MASVAASCSLASRPDGRGDASRFRSASGLGLLRFTEYGPDGTVHLDAKLPDGGQNYRAFRFPWVGTPLDKPRLKVRSEHGHRTVYVSWNGATEVARWRLESGPSRTDLKNARAIERKSFESAFPPLGSDDHFGAVIALDKHGKTLGRSAVARVTT